MPRFSSLALPADCFLIREPRALRGSASPSSCRVQKWTARSLKGCTATFFRLVVPNPVAVALSVYVPAGRFVMRYSPLALVVLVVFTPVASFVAVTVTLGMAAPEASVTVPTKSPLMTRPFSLAEGAHSPTPRIRAINPN